MNLKLAAVQKYAHGKAPFVGIPVDGVGVIVVMRTHLNAALETGPTRILYNLDTKILTLRTHKTEWKLNDLLGQGKVSRYDIQSRLSTWASGRRSSRKTREATQHLGKKGVYVRKLNEEVAKLLRRRDKIVLHRPVSPLIPSDYHREVSDYEREHARNWADEKCIRKALAKIAGHKMLHGDSTWAEFYRKIETVSGRPVSNQQKYARVHGCKRYRQGLPNYPSREDYLKNLPRYLGLAEKPWDHRPWDPYKKDEWGDRLNALESHSAARREYCALLRERMALDSQIAAHQSEINSITGVA